MNKAARKAIMRLCATLLVLGHTAPVFAQSTELTSAVQTFNGGQYPQAADMFVQYLRQQPNDALAHYYLAVTWHCMGRGKEAANEYNWVLHNSPDQELLKRANMGLTVVSRTLAGEQPAVAQAYAAPQQPTAYAPQQPTAYAPQQPTAYAPQQPTAYAPQQPTDYATQQPTAYAPQQPTAYAPQQPTTYAPQQPTRYAPEQQMYAPQQQYTSQNVGRGYQPPAQAQYGTTAGGAGTTGWLSGRGAQQAAAATGGALPSSVGMQGRIVDLYTQWCGWCKKFEPIFVQAQAKYGSAIQFERIDAEAPGNERLVKKYKVRGYPTVLLLDNNGNLRKRIDGAPQSLQEFETTIFAAYPTVRSY